MKKYYLQSVAVVICLAFIMQACKKSESLTIPPEQAHFVQQSSGTLFVLTSTSSITIPIGLTNVSEENRTVNISITSPTGAVQGTHYNIASKALVIPAGKAIDSFTVSGVLAQYQTGRKDTLIITIGTGGVAPSDYNSTYTLALRGPCFEGEISTDFAAALPGTYLTLENAFNANGSVAYANAGPYNTTVKNVTRTSATTVDITVTNIYGIAAWEAKFTLDFSNLASKKVTTTSQRLGSGAPLGLAAYDMYVEPPSLTQNLPSYGDFIFCQNTINLKFRLGARDPGTGALAGYLSEATGGGTATYVMSMDK